ncbi:MAG: sugar transferase [Flavobacteriaceae bacterium]|nr:sugar transferase [Flavobacteriaceae bacterium]
MKKQRGLNTRQQFVKRVFDFFFSFLGLVVFSFPIFVLMVFAAFSTKKFGLFKQVRVGEKGKLFKIYKIRTMKVDIPKEDFITLKNDDRITPFGKVLRKFKLDELPQLFNVLIGEMSLVGPRPDVPGYADNLVGNDRIILTVKPGLTGPATIKFKNEEDLLSQQKNPKKYNDKVIWPEKVILNKQYIEEWSLFNDIKCIVKTIIS